MAVPSTMSDLSTTAASNSPAGSEAVGANLDNYIRALSAIIKQENTDMASTTDGKGVSKIGGAGRIVDTIAALKALDKTANSRVFVSGYTAVGDGGGGNYWYDASDTTSTDNSGTIIVATDGGRWKLQESQVLSAYQFGCTGDGSTNDTTKAQALLDYCCANGKTAWFPDGTFSVTELSVTDGIEGIVCDGVIKGRGSASVAVIELGSAGNPVQHARFTLHMDMSAGDLRAVQGYDTVGCTFKGCRIYGFINSASTNHYAFWMDGPCKENVFDGNHITLYDTPTQRGFGIAFYGTAADTYGGFFTGAIIRATDPAVGNAISNNVILNGSYAISLQQSERNTVVGNYCKNQNHRSVYVAGAAWGNTVVGNVFTDFLSTAVLLGFCAHHNVVSDNFCESSNIAGQAAINCNTGSSYNLIDSNKIRSACLFGVYLAVDVVGNVVSNNLISNHYLCAIGLENDFIETRPTNAIFTLPQYDAPPAPYTEWSQTNSTDNVIKGNVIGDGYSGRSTAAISLAQIDGLGLTQLLNNTVANNIVRSGTNIAYNLHFYADTPGDFTGTVLTGNNFHPDNAELSATTTGPTTWADRIAYYRDNKELDATIDNESIVFTDADTTPSVSTNSPNRIFSFSAYTGSTSVTDFDDGFDGQVIVLRLASVVTIVYNSALIRTKGLTNVSGGSTNNFISFRQQSGIWIEQWRSF